VWAQIKHHINIKIKDMDQLIQQGFDSVTADMWTDCIEHVKRVEAGMWRADDTEPSIMKIG
jgi:hypothetical protein